MPFLIFLLFVSVPIAEIAVFIEVGSEIGVAATLAFTVLTAFLGVVLLRVQGLSTFARAQASLDAGEAPVAEMVHGVFLAAAGILLLVPGFLTDALGFLLFIPPVRLALGRRLMRSLARGRVHVYGARPQGPGQGPGQGPVGPGAPPNAPRGPSVIEGEVVEEIDEEDGKKGPGNPHSPWKP